MKERLIWVLVGVMILIALLGCGAADGVVEDPTWTCMEQTYDQYGNPTGWKVSQEWECQNGQ